MALPSIFPLYQSPSFMRFNVSLGLPGLALWDLGTVGKYAQLEGFPNTISSLLVPDMEYIKMFIDNELGIAQKFIQDGYIKEINEINSIIENVSKFGKYIPDSEQLKKDLGLDALKQKKSALDFNRSSLTAKINAKTLAQTAIDTTKNSLNEQGNTEKPGKFEINAQFSKDGVKSQLDGVKSKFDNLKSKADSKFEQFRAEGKELGAQFDKLKSRYEGLGANKFLEEYQKLKNKANIREEVEKSFGSFTEKSGLWQEYQGFQAIEKVIISSIYETAKPYLEIVKTILDMMFSIEDIIARIAPLIGAAVNPLSVLAIRSRKPVGNGPKKPDSAIGPYGSPQAIGFQKGAIIKNALNDLDTQLQKGANIEIDDNGNVNYEPGPVLKSLVPVPYDELPEDFDFVTVSTIYTTGTFEPTVKYNYIFQYLKEIEIKPIQNPEPPEVDPRPKRIILGIYDSQGIAFDPKSKIQYWGLDNFGNFEKKNSIFEKAPWLIGEKWILDKAIDGNGNKTTYTSWQEINGFEYYWKRGLFKYTWSESQPSDKWDLLKYKNVLDFSNPENQYNKFKENEPVTRLKPDVLNFYKEYFNELTNQEIAQAEQETPVDANTRFDIYSFVSKLFTSDIPLFKDDKISEEILNIYRFAELKETYFGPNNQYQIDLKDWIEKENPPTGTIPKNLRKAFRPMKFALDTGDIWISPENEYDLKIIRVDSVKKLDFSDEVSIVDQQPKNLQKNSDITNFVKNIFELRLFDAGEPDKNINFSIDIFKNGALIESLDNVNQYTLTNHNLEFDGLKYNIKNNSYRFRIFYKDIVNRNNPDISTYMDFVFDSNSQLRGNSGNFILPRLFKKTNFNIILPIFYIDENGKKNRKTIKTFNYSTSDIENILIVDSSTSTQTGEYAFNVWDNSLWGPKRVVTSNESPWANSKSFRNELIISSIEPFRVQLFDKSSKKIIASEKYNIRNILNKNLEDLNKKEIPFSQGRYGSGWQENPQRVGYLRRAQTTELDTETYYIVEGLLRSQNNDKSGGGGESLNGFYTIKDAVAMIPVMIKFLVKLLVRLIPKLNKYVKLLENPPSFVLSILTGKFEENVEFFFSDELNKLRDMVKLSAQIQVNQYYNEKIKNLGFLKKMVENSAFRNFILVTDKGELKSLIDGKSFVDLFGIQFGLELNFNSILSQIKMPDISVKENYTILDLKKSVLPDIQEPDAKNIAAQIKLGGNFQDNLNNFKKDLQNETKKISDSFKNVNLKEVVKTDFDIQKLFNVKIGSPIKPIFSNNLKLGLNVNLCRELFRKNRDTKQKPDTLDSLINAPGLKSNKGIREEISVVYSTGEYKEGVDYQYIYLTEDLTKLIKEADDLVNAYSQNTLEVMTPGGVKQTIDLSEGKNKKTAAIDILQTALALYKQASSLISQLKNAGSLKNLIASKIDNLQKFIGLQNEPMFQVILGIISIPLRIICQIICFLIDFFKSLLNPIEFPSKMIEFLSFDWIKKFFTPVGLAQLSGITLEPSKVLEWCVLSRLKNPLFGKIPDWLKVLFTQKNTQNPIQNIFNNFKSQIENFTKQTTGQSKLDFKANPLKNFENPLNDFLPANFPIDNLQGGQASQLPFFQEYLLPDDYVIADLQDFIHLPFLGLPEKYTVKQIREFCTVKNPMFNIGLPFLCLLERIINAFIMLIWSSFGITAIIPPPFVKWCRNIPKAVSESDLQDLLNGFFSDDPDDTYDFIYDVTLPDGTVLKDIDKEGLQKFIDDNKDLNFEFSNFQTL